MAIQKTKQMKKILYIVFLILIFANPCKAEENYKISKGKYDYHVDQSLKVWNTGTEVSISYNCSTGLKLLSGDCLYTIGYQVYNTGNINPTQPKKAYLNFYFNKCDGTRGIPKEYYIGIKKGEEYETFYTGLCSTGWKKIEIPSGWLKYIFMNGFTDFMFTTYNPGSPNYLDFRIRSYEYGEPYIPYLEITQNNLQQNNLIITTNRKNILYGDYSLLFSLIGLIISIRLLKII